MKSRIFIATAASIVLGAGLFSGSARAKPPEGEIERTDLAKGTTDAPVAIVAVGQPTTFYIQEVVLAPGASSGWHTHSGPEYSTVTEGTVLLQTAPNCVPTAYAAGEAVFIPAAVPHRVFNQGPGDAVAMVTYTLPAQNPVRDDAPAACP
jgi:quercetin dioxygenase-like cupin family protein